MHGEASLTSRVPTGDDVLAYLQADYRLRAGIDPEVDEGEELRADTTVEEWRFICDLVSVGRLAPVMDQWMGTAYGTGAWRAALEPEGERTLGELAAFTAIGTRWPTFASASLGGTPDPAAGAFLCLRGLLARAGVPVATLRPSTPVAAIATAHLNALGNALAKLAPALVPVPVVRGSYLAYAMAKMLSAVGVRVGHGGWSVEFGPWSTFADLARAIASNRQATA